MLSIPETLNFFSENVGVRDVFKILALNKVPMALAEIVQEVHLQEKDIRACLLMLGQDFQFVENLPNGMYALTPMGGMCANSILSYFYDQQSADKTFIIGDKELAISSTLAGGFATFLRLPNGSYVNPKGEPVSLNMIFYQLTHNAAGFRVYLPARTRKPSKINLLQQKKKPTKLHLAS